MPVCTLHLLSIGSDLHNFLVRLRSASPPPLIVSRVIRWVIKPTSISTKQLLNQDLPWDLLMVYRDATGLPESLKSFVRAVFTVQAGVPSALITSFSETNKKLLHPEPGSIPALTGSLAAPRLTSSAQALELSDELRSWMDGWDPEHTRGAVSMLNFLAFKPGMHAEYLKYGKAFAECIGSRRGGKAKIVGKVVGGDDDGWEEVAIAHYPSIWHFADMAASQDYQEVNHRNRLPSLKDTCILMTSELEVPWNDAEVAKL